MGNMCNCNLANKINAVTMTLLCVTAGVLYWYYFDQAVGVVGFDSCRNSDAQDDRLCQGRAAAGSLVLIAAVVALVGGFSSNPERNQATVSSSFGLINLAQAVFLLVTYDEIATDEDKLAGAVHILGGLLGLFYAVWTCKKGSQDNNITFIGSIFLYALAFSITAWHNFDAHGCSTDQIKQISDDVHNIDSGDICTMRAFQGVFVLACMLLCLFAAFRSFCQNSLQPRTQTFVICASIACIFAYYAATYWYNFSHAPDFGEAGCNTDKPQESNGTFCRTMAVGGLLALIGIPLSGVVGVLFCCKCINVKEEDYEDPNSNNTFGV